MDGYFNQKFPKISEMSAKVPQNLAKFLKSIPTKLLLGKVPKCVLFGGIITAFVFQPYPLAKNKHYLPCTGRKSQFLGAMKIFRRAPPIFARGKGRGGDDGYSKNTSTKTSSESRRSR